MKPYEQGKDGETTTSPESTLRLLQSDIAEANRKIQVLSDLLKASYDEILLLGENNIFCEHDAGICACATIQLLDDISTTLNLKVST